MNGPAPTAVYLYAGDQIIENVTTANFYFQDTLGNTSHVTDAVGNLKERYTYDAFGTPTFRDATGALIGVTPGTPTGASALGIRHLFQGQLWTQETGLNDYRNRVELPTMGVFLQPDPIGFKGDAANIYRFCGNDPVDRTDPLGLEDVSISGRLNTLGIQASINSRQSFLDHPELGTGSRAQLVQENGVSHQLSLQSKIVQGYSETVTKRVIGSNIPKTIGTRVIENILADRGYLARGIGHAHDDKRSADPNWSTEDYAAARGVAATAKHPGVKGKPVWKALTSDGSHVMRLTPQTVPGQQPTEQIFSTKGIQPTGNLSTVTSSGPSAADVDAANQKTGVMSLGAETVNYVNGKL